MPSIFFQINDSLTSRSSFKHQYMVAGRSFFANHPIGLLSPFSHRSKEIADWQQPPDNVDDGKVTSFHEVDGWVARAWRQVLCYANGSTYRIAVEDMGLFVVGADGCNIIFIDPGNHWVDEDTISEALFGPVLSIALAVQGTFLLNASALLIEDRIFAFVGDPGSGKSTLASYLASEIGEWQYIADDALPIELGPDGPIALPHFPQMKLSPDEQVSMAIPERLRLGGVYLLSVPDEPSMPSAIPMDDHDASTALAQHTIATSLFDAHILGQHMDACTHIAAQVPVQYLIYPHQEELLPDVSRVLAANIAELI